MIPNHRKQIAVTTMDGPLGVPVDNEILWK